MLVSLNTFIRIMAFPREGDMNKRICNGRLEQNDNVVGSLDPDALGFAFSFCSTLALDCSSGPWRFQP